MKDSTSSIFDKGTLSQDQIDALLARPGMLAPGLSHVEGVPHLSQTERLTEETRKASQALVEGYLDGI